MADGKAYGFFNCDASKEEIEAELPAIRDYAQIPSELEIVLIEGMDAVKGDNKLMSIVREAQDAGIRYFVEATYPTATNDAAADEIAALLNQAYQSPLYHEGAEFIGHIVYDKNGEFVFRD